MELQFFYFFLTSLSCVVILCALLTLYVSHVAALDFTNSKWIWTSSDGASNVAPLATAYFRLGYFDPKNALYANVMIAADDNYTLYVNGELIGQGNNYRISQTYCVKLDSTAHTRVFAVAVQNQGTVPNPAALLVAINIVYTDITTATVVSDANWRANNNEIAGFESVGFDDSAWPYAVVVGNADSPIWGLPSPLSTSTLSLANSYWIWNNQVPPGSPTSTAPVGNFAFRKTYKIPGDMMTDSGTIIVDADDAFTLYINGEVIGSSDSYTQAQRWNFYPRSSTDTIVLAINATNNGGPAGFIVAAAFNIVGCSGTALFKVTDGTPDGTWKFNLDVPDGFEQSGYDDSDWGSTIVEGPYGVAPWGSVPIVDGKGIYSN